MPARKPLLSESAGEWLTALLIAALVLVALAVQWDVFNFGLLALAAGLLLWLFFRVLGLGLSREKDRATCNYKALEISDDAIIYTDLSNRAEVIRFADILRIVYVRSEALFPDLFGPYIESSWSIRTRERIYIEVMDEAPHQGKLIAAFRKHFSGLDEAALSVGLKASDEGQWVYYLSTELQAEEQA